MVPVQPQWAASGRTAVERPGLERGVQLHHQSVDGRTLLLRRQSRPVGGRRSPVPRDSEDRIAL